ncbi:MAG TPA: hypothetical protein DCP28_36480, partial [Cytophagales bacterium]|nr:hypothetical protein [Cytophagales bacterium]
MLLPAWGFSQVPIDASETSITLSANALVANGIDSALLTIQLVDTEGTPLSTGGATVRAQSTLGAISPTPLTDHGDGTYSGVLVSG